MPARIEFSETFNICGPFVDRHLQEGRGDKAFARGRTWALTFAQLHAGVCRMANVLRSLGIRAGDRVMLLAKDCPAFYFGFLGAVRIGAVVVPTNTFMRAADYAYMLANFEAKAVLVSDGTIDEVLPALAQPGAAVKHRIAIDGPRQGWHLLDDLLASASPECPMFQRPQIPRASGSTPRARPAHRRPRCTSTRI